MAFYFLNVTYKPGRKVPPFNFFGTVRLFFSKFFQCPQRVSPLSFLLFCYRMRVYKSKRVPLLHFSALRDIFRKKIFFRKFQVFCQKNVLHFLSLRYSADLRRSRLVVSKMQYPKSPLTTYQPPGKSTGKENHLTG